MIPASKRKDTHPCECGGVAEQLLFDDEKDESERVPGLIIRGNQRPMKVSAIDFPVGWEKGNTNAERQEARYAEAIETTRRRAREVDKDAIKGGIRHIASIPRELHRLRSRQYGKGYFDPGSQSTAELKAKLKADRLYFHTD